jgi:hypothetical protein
MIVRTIFAALFFLADFTLTTRATTSVTLAWDPSPDNVAGYIIYIATSGSSQVGANDVGNTTIATAGNLMDGQTYVFYATAYDTNGVESDPSNSVTYTAPAANQPPVIASVPDQVADEGKLLQFAVSATDPDSPAQTLTFALTTAPSGAQIDPATGVFSWVPQANQAPSTNNVTVTVTDNGSPALTASQSFKIVVRSGFYLTVTSSPYGTVAISPLGSLNSQGTQYISGASVSATAKPQKGIRFDHWLLDGSVFAQNPLTFTMTSDHTLTAYYAQGNKLL